MKAKMQKEFARGQTTILETSAIGMAELTTNCGSQIRQWHNYTSPGHGRAPIKVLYRQNNYL